MCYFSVPETRHAASLPKQYSSEWIVVDLEPTVRAAFPRGEIHPATLNLLRKQISTFIQLAIDSSNKAELLSQLVMIGRSIARSTQEAV